MTVQDQVKKEAERRYPYIWPKNKEGEPITQPVGANPPNSAKIRKMQEAFISGAEYYSWLMRSTMDLGIDGLDLAAEQYAELPEGMTVANSKAANTEKKCSAFRAGAKWIMSVLRVPVFIKAETEAPDQNVDLYCSVNGIPKILSYDSHYKMFYDDYENSYSPEYVSWLKLPDEPSKPQTP